MGKKKPPKSMHGAAAQDNVESMEAFYAADATTLNERNKDGWTPLMTAAYRGEDR